MSKRKFFEVGGLVAAVILVAFGIGALVMGMNGRSTVRSNLKAEQITFGDAAQDPTVPAKYSNALVDTGAEARAFAKMMRVHTLEASGGLTYAQLGRFVAASDPTNPKGTSDEAAALKDDKGNPVSNSTRNTWVTETALTTALNAAYMGEQISNFGIVVGIALLLTGIGFSVLAIGGALRHETAKAAVATLPGSPVPTT